MRMKRNFKVIMMLMLVLAMSFGAMVSTSAKTNETIVIDNKILMQTGVGNRQEAKFHTTMGYAWCITPFKVGAENGAVLTYSKVENDGGILYLLDRSLTSDMGYLQTQLALW